MVGFARFITDRVTFAYLTDLTDVGSGPGCEGSTPASAGWPELRSLWLVASTSAAARMYMGALGAEEVARHRPTPSVADSGMLLVEMPGPANDIRFHATKNGTEAP
ncbi:MAG: hypothetical protein STHCBS139747_003929 [Sporothrix thermara]